MPVLTRSGSERSRLDAHRKLERENESIKRKAASPPSNARSKKQPQAKSDDQVEANITTDVVDINRAPVLELWAAMVAAFVHPELSWQTCLSVGGAISTLCAISKGRAIGSIEKPDAAESKQKQEDRRNSAGRKQDKIDVMHFQIPLRDGRALVGDKPKKPNESLLMRKFGDDFDTVEGLFRTALQSWRGSEVELNDQAFHMYEKFRPSVPSGQRGWGRKGQLSLKKTGSVIEKPGVRSGFFVKSLLTGVVFLERNVSPTNVEQE